MISNIMDPKHPFLLPRTVPTSAGVIFQQPELSIIKDLQDEPFSVMIVRPDVENTVSLSTIVPSAVIDDRSRRQPHGSKHVKVNWPNNTSLSCSTSFLTDAGNTIYPDIEAGSANIIESDGSISRLQVATYKNLQWGNAATLTFDMRGSFDQETTGSISLVKNGVIILTNTLTFTAGATENRLQATLTSSSSNNLDQPSQILVNFPSGLEGDSIYYGVRLLGFTQGPTTTFKHHSLWDLLGNVDGAQTCKEQYEKAERYSITGFSALLSNTTASQYRSGSIVTAQLPGGSEHLVPSDPEKAYRFAASYNDPKTYSGQLSKGMHWFFTPEKVQDWFFRPTEDTIGDRPFLVVAWSGVATNDLANKYGAKLKVRINIELLSTDISLIKFMPTADLARLMDVYVTLVAAHGNVGENPEHERRVKRIASQIMSNPYTKSALRMALNAGTKLIPLALAAL